MADDQNTQETVKVTIFGEEYSIRGYADTEYILRVADYVDKKMREIALNSKNRAPHKIAVLTALNLAGELMDYKDKDSSELDKVDEKAKNILELLDGALSESA
jgi:cell division protein ZapA